MNHRFRLSSQRLMAAALPGLLGAATVAAQPVAPDAGSLLRQFRINESSLPRADEAPQLQIRQADQVRPVDSTPFFLQKLEFSGNTRLPTAALNALAAGLAGREVSLRELDELTRRITSAYRDQGFPLARAVLPAQTIENGVVRIDVYEATLGSIKLSNASAVRDSVIRTQTSNLRPNEVVTDAALERALLLASDLPATDFEAVLKPGERVGSTDLELRTRPRRPWDVNIGADNGGGRSTGRYRVSGSALAYNPLGLGDVFSLSAITSGADLGYLRGSAEAPLPVAGLRAGVSASALRYELGGDLAALDGQGTARQITAWTAYALERSVQRSTYVSVQADRVQLRDTIGVSRVFNHRHIDLGTLELSGNLRQARSLTAWSASLGWGRLAFDDADAAASDANSARSAGQFKRAELRVNHLRPLDRAELLFSGRLQLASKNLDSSQKLQLGGSTTMRAYDSNAASGDQGVQLSVDYRRDLARTDAGRWRWHAFAEAANLEINAQAWVPGSRNSLTLYGLGGGLSLDAAGWTARAVVASPVGKPAIEGVKRAARLWVDVGYAF